MSSPLSTQEAYTVVFLTDDPPGKVVLLQRAVWKPFAPLWYTGIGGTLENGETPYENAIRELNEETGFAGIALTEFARCVIRGQNKIVYYFWGLYPGGPLPPCSEGILEWADLAAVADYKVIPTTALVMAEWAKRRFATDRPWTLYCRPIPGDVGLDRELEQVVAGLSDA